MSSELNTVADFERIYSALRESVLVKPFYARGRVRKQVEDLIAKLNEHGVYVGEYLDYCVRQFGVHELFVNRVCSATVVDQFLRNNPNLQQAAEITVNLQIQRLGRTHKYSRIPIHELLLDEVEDYTPQFRLIMAEHFGYNDIVERYRPAAEKEMLLKPREGKYLKALLEKVRGFSSPGNDGGVPATGQGSNVQCSVSGVGPYGCFESARGNSISVVGCSRT